MWVTSTTGDVSTLQVGVFSLTATKDGRWRWEVADGGGVALASGSRRSLASAREAASTWLALALVDAGRVPAATWAGDTD